MCVSKGAPSKPAYGPCNERHAPHISDDLFAALFFMVAIQPVLKVMESVMKSQMKEAAECV